MPNVTVRLLVSQICLPHLKVVDLKIMTSTKLVGAVANQHLLSFKSTGSLRTESAVSQ